MLCLLCGAKTAITEASLLALYISSLPQTIGSVQVAYMIIGLTDKERKIIDGVLLLFCGVMYFTLEQALPDWMMNMMLCGVVALSHCIYKVM